MPEAGKGYFLEGKLGAFIFLCDVNTEQECLDRNLFGTNPGDQHTYHYSKISVGDTLFLYNFQTGLLRGTYVAETRCTMNIEPTAWKKVRKSFPWQVRVDAERAFKTPITVDDFCKIITLATTRVGLLPPPELTEQQTEQLVAVFSLKNGAS